MVIGRDKSLWSVALTMNRKRAMSNVEHSVLQSPAQFTGLWFSLVEYAADNYKLQPLHQHVLLSKDHSEALTLEHIRYDLFVCNNTKLKSLVLKRG